MGLRWQPAFVCAHDANSCPDDVRGCEIAGGKYGEATLIGALSHAAREVGNELPEPPASTLKDGAATATALHNRNGSEACAIFTAHSSRRGDKRVLVSNTRATTYQRAR